MKQRESKTTGLLVLTVFTVFALCILMVLLTGARGYEALVRRGEKTYACRTAAQYLATRVRQSDTADGISVEDFGGQSALVLRQEIDGETYLTRIYCHDGFLRELFTTEKGSFSPEDGEKLTELTALSFEKTEAMLSARLLLAEGAEQQLHWYLRSGEVRP